jgi:phosphoglycolate phosphatase-like HAD superfamily hydrolase
MKNINNIISKESILIFDLDGTLIETDEANLYAYKEAIKQVKKFELLSYCSTNMRFTSEELIQVFPMLDTKEHNEIINIKNSVYIKYLNKTSINMELFTIIHKFSKTNTIILATKANQKRADLILKYHNLEDFFDYKFYNQSYKGNSNKFEYILKCLKIDPKQSIIFENDKVEIESAKLVDIPEDNIIYINKGEQNYE